MNTQFKTRIALGAILGLGFHTTSALAQWSGTNPLWTTSKVGTTVSSASGIVNSLEVGGSALIGSGYAGTSTSGPTNGLAIQGNVGIGTTTPAAALDINGNIQLTGEDAAPTSGRSIVKGGTGRLNLYSNTYYGNSYNWIELYGSDPVNLGQLRLAGTKIMFMDNTDGAGAFTVGMTLSSSGKLSIGPSGTWGFDASEVLDVKGNVKFSGALMPNNDPGTSGKLLMSQGVGNPPIWTDGNSTAWLLSGNSGTTFGTNFIGTTDPTSLMFKTNGSEEMSLLKGGDLRIGPTETGTKTPLVPGDYPQGGDDGLIFSGSQSFGATFDDDNSDPLWIARHNVANDVSELRIVLGDNAASGPTDFATFGALNVDIGNEFVPRVKIQSTGGVGVGTIPDGGAGAPPLAWTPQNRVDIFKGNEGIGLAPANPVTNGTVVIPLPNGNVSGLRLSDFAGATQVAQFNAAAGAMPFYLSVNTSGDVILAKCGCPNPTTAGSGGNPPPEIDNGGGGGASAQMDALYSRVAALEAEVENLKASASGVTPAASAADAQSQIGSQVQFFQNDPNPFSESTDISYVIPESIQQATLIVTDRIGHVVYSQLIADRGNGKTTMSASSLPAGTYLYSLVVDGIYLQGKKMVVIK